MKVWIYKCCKKFGILRKSCIVKPPNMICIFCKSEIKPKLDLKYKSKPVIL